jgi:putative Ca2+/H+ antiporter (TMEM165/GDT1 family)
MIVNQSALLAVVFGNQISVYVSPERLKIVAGVGFVLIGVWTLKEGLIPVN